MLKDMKVQACMTHPAMTITPTTSVRLAQRIMRDYHIRHLPVVKENKLIGILSSGDVRRASPSHATSLSVWEIHALWEQIEVGDVMTRNVVTVSPETPILEAVRLMYEHRFNGLPVVEDDGQLAGILTEVDIFLLLLHEGEDVAPLPTSSEYPVAAMP